MLHLPVMTFDFFFFFSWFPSLRSPFSVAGSARHGPTYLVWSIYRPSCAPRVVLHAEWESGLPVMYAVNPNMSGDHRLPLAVASFRSSTPS